MTQQFQELWKRDSDKYLYVNVHRSLFTVTKRWGCPRVHRWTKG